MKLIKPCSRPLTRYLTAVLLVVPGGPAPGY